MTIYPTKKYDMTVRSTIVLSEKANKGLDAIEAANPHQMNRLSGFLQDGKKVVIAQRPGKGGMDFTKLMGGKVYAVAADGVSPVFEKDKDGKPTKTQKEEDGLPLYSSSGFYLLSSKEYPALDIFEAYTLLLNKGEKALLLTRDALEQRQAVPLTDDLDLEMLQGTLLEALSDANNLVAKHDEAMNKKRRRAISRAKEEADDAGEAYAGVEFTDLAVNKKDGNPFIYYAWKTGSASGTGRILREVSTTDTAGRDVTQYLTAEEALAAFVASADFKALEFAIARGDTADFNYVTGHVMRSSVSFKRKVENHLANAAPGKTVYGDGVYIQAALGQWTKGIVALLHSLHPNFPAADYDAHPYVAALRQAEIGMSKKQEGGWTAPQALTYDLDAILLK